MEKGFAVLGSINTTFQIPGSSFPILFSQKDKFSLWVLGAAITT
jgi:uncharacterized protein YbdZ (MbtH family)